VSRFTTCSYQQTKLISVVLYNQLRPGTVELALSRTIDDFDISAFHHRFHKDDKGPERSRRCCIRSRPVTKSTGRRSGGTVGESGQMDRREPRWNRTAEFSRRLVSHTLK
jgi:hypothetical protein